MIWFYLLRKNSQNDVTTAGKDNQNSGCQIENGDRYQQRRNTCINRNYNIEYAKN